MTCRLLTLTALLLTLSGCHPLQVITTSRVTTDPLTVKTEFPPRRNPKPLVEQVVAGPKACRGGKVALIDVDGLMLNRNQAGLLHFGDNAVDLFREKLQYVATGRDYRAVVVRINSPGGGVTACDIMRRDLAQFRLRTGLPVVVVLMDVGTGGAYYLASASDHIVAHPTTITGGLGVILNLYNLQDAMAQFNIYANTIKGGLLTDLGTPNRAIEEDEEALLEDIAREFHDRLIDGVLQVRPEVADYRERVFDGRILTARQALEVRLIDRVGYLEDAIHAAQQLGGCSDASVVLLSRCGDPARTIYSISPDSPVEGPALPFGLPGITRERLPTFMYLWQPDPTLPL